MVTDVREILGREFRRRSEVEFQQGLARQREEQERRARQEKDRERSDDIVEAMVSALSEAEVVSFRAELDTYDEATVIALQHNSEALAIVRERLEQILSQAYVLPDGRRVFRTEDGLRVFDEHGIELDRSIIDPDAIPEEYPTWETYQPFLAEQARLLEERRELLEYQEHLDEARERLDSGDMGREEYDDLRSSLDASMPASIRAQLDDPHEPASTPTAATRAETAPVALDLSGDMVPAGMVPRL